MTRRLMSMLQGRLLGPPGPPHSLLQERGLREASVGFCHFSFHSIYHHSRALSFLRGAVRSLNLSPKEEGMLLSVLFRVPSHLSGGRGTEGAPREPQVDDPTSDGSPGGQQDSSGAGDAGEAYRGDVNRG